MKNLYLLTILFITVFSQITFGQKTEPDNSDSEKAKTFAFSDIKSFPVIFGREKDGLPKIIKTRGIIEEFTIGFFSCGILHWSGTAKIKLLDKVEKYESQYIYIVSSCFLTTNEEALNKVVEIKLSKLKKWDKQKYGSIVNTLDSKGLVFYNLDKIQFSK